MPASFQISRDLNLVYVKFSDAVTVSDLVSTFKAYTSHPDFDLGQRHVIDLSTITSFEKDVVGAMAFQAIKAELLVNYHSPTMLIYLAPTRLALGIARQLERAWDGVDGIIVRIVSEEVAVRDIIGQPSLRLSALGNKFANNPFVAMSTGLPDFSKRTGLA